MTRIASLSSFGFPHTPAAPFARDTDNRAVAAANGAVYIRVMDGGRVSKIAYRVLTQGGNMSLAVYRNSGLGRLAVPGARLATTGSFTVPVAGYYEASLGASINVQVGDWLALSCDSATATFNSLLAGGVDNSVGLGMKYRQATAHPLPATPSGLVAVQGYDFVLIGVA